MDIKRIVQNKTIRKGMLRAFRVLSLLNQVIPKQKNKILLYDSFNTELEDNTRALLLHLLRRGYQKKYRILIGMPRNSRYHEFAPQGIRTIGPVGCIFHFLTAKYFFTSYGNTRISPSGKQMVINLWHGTPLKTIGRLGGDHPEEKLDYFTRTLAASDFYRPIMSKAFGCSPKKIMICGHARTDELFSETDDFPALGFGEKWTKKVMWMPTFRVSSDGIYSEGMQGDEAGTGLPVIRTQQEYQKLNQWLQERGILIVIKVHNYSAALGIKDLSNIHVVSGEALRSRRIELYSLIKSFDALITDYSSVMFDFLLLDRPIGFAVDDLEQYESSRGFVVDNPRDFMPGLQFEEPDGMRAFLESLLSGTDSYREQRVRVRKMTNQYCDGKNCGRLLHRVGIRT